MRHFIAGIAATITAALVVTSSSHAQLRVAPVGERSDSQTLELLLRKLSSSGTFMLTDAHPDDEDNGLLAKLGYGRGMRTVVVTAGRTKSVPSWGSRWACCAPKSCSRRVDSTARNSSSRAPWTSATRSAS